MTVEYIEPRSSYCLKRMGFIPDQASRTSLLWKACEGITTEELMEITSVYDDNDRLLRLADQAREAVRRIESGVPT